MRSDDNENVGNLNRKDDSLLAHARRSTLPLPPPLFAPLPWTTFPGLFAAGGLDVMTAALLAALPLPAPRARVCDFACGSGTLTAALLAREPSLRVDALDADAVALAAAALNAPAARICEPTDGWPIPTNAKHRRYHLIVSNPPVHRGQPDDLRVLRGLLMGAITRLRTSGALYIVAQAHVPVGPLAANAGLRAVVERVGGGHFLVWRCVK